MHFANEYDVDMFVSRHVDHNRPLADQDRPNLARAAANLARLMYWTNSVSDGWAYWSKPVRSADRLITLLEEADRTYRRGGELEDITTAELRRALTPVKAMLTRVSRDGVSTRYDGGPVLLEA